MSSKKTVNLFDAEIISSLNGYVYNGAFLPGLYGYAFTKNIPNNDKCRYVKYSHMFDTYFLIGEHYISKSTDGLTFDALCSIEGEDMEVLDYYNSDGEPCIIFYNSKQSVLLSGEKITYSNEPSRMKGAIMHCGRAFFIPEKDRMSVGWTAPLDMMSLDESIDAGGWVKLDPNRGKVLDLLEYGDKIVAVRQYGLTFLSMMGSPENFKADITQTDTEEIYPKSAQVLNGKIYFYSASGICVYDGSEIKRLPFRYVDNVLSVICSAVYNGKYFIACLSSVQDSGDMYCYDPETDVCYTVGIGRSTYGSFCIEKEFRLYTDAYWFKFQYAPGYILQTGEVNFGSWKNKTITEVFVDGVADVAISNGSVTRTFRKVKGKIHPRIRGKSFTFKLTAEPPTCNAVRAFTATVEESDGI